MASKIEEGAKWECNFSPNVCPGCGKEFKNLGAHMRFCNKPTEGELAKYQPEEPLGNVIADLKEALKRYQYEIEYTVNEKSGSVKQVIVRIQFK